MTLLPGVAFVLVVAFFATAVALNAGLIGCPFRFRLGSFILFFVVVGTRLAVNCIDLHLLQPIVIIPPGGNVPLGLSVGFSLEVITFLFHLHFENAGVNLNGKVCHVLEGRWPHMAHRDFHPDLFL